jgi:23S rRNA (guanosine2251-2'-O)-methyltransferase
MKPHVGHKRTRKPHANGRRDSGAPHAQERPAPQDKNSPPQTAERGGERLYGLTPVVEALRAGARSVEQVVIAEGAQIHRLHDLLELARRANVPVRRAARAEFTRLAGEGVNHQGVMASVAAARYTEADELLDALSARVGTHDPPLAVVLDGVEDPRNLGAILRTVDCAGAHGVFIPERRAVGLTETVAKAAAGALEYVRVARATNLARLVEELKERNIWTVGTSGEAGMEYTAWDYTQPTALLFGGEGEGLHRLVRERCDVLVRIPLQGATESLNVSVAAGIMLYEALRQRAVAQKNSNEETKGRVEALSRPGP